MDDEFKINGYLLDSEQKAIVLDSSKHLLVVAGAGSGKTFTILGKIGYLIKRLHIDPKKILCISFTRMTADSLKQKIKKEFECDIAVYTFHKLSLEILKHDQKNYEIADSNILDNLIHEFFSITVLDYPFHMKLILRYFRQKIKKNIRSQYLKFYYASSDQVHLFEKLLTTFLHLMKSNSYSLASFSSFLKKIRFTFSYRTYLKEKIFLIIACNLYLQYQEYLTSNNEIDFDDMIMKATDFVHDHGISKPYEYVIIDEYQDTSYVRFLLIREILKQTNANFMVVGDDFQSIYRFTGCDLSLFLDFKNYFKDAKIMKIQNTYRNSQELIQIAGDFVMKNPKQIPKRLHSNKHLENPIQIIYYHNICEKFKKLVLEIYQNTHQPILILGRNNKDVHMLLDSDFELKEDGTFIWKKNPQIFMYYMTVHKSKGLEEENVIIINLENRLLGFPNQIQDDKILRLVSNSSEKYPFSEERRLFYVALTRTKNKAYLLVPIKNPSIFIRDIKLR